MQETSHMGETEREIDVEIQGESHLILDLSLCLFSPPSSPRAHTHTVWATYVLLHPFLLARARASAPATLPRARAAYVGKVGTTEGGRWAGWAADG